GATRLTHASLGHLMCEFPWAVPAVPVVRQPLRLDPTQAPVSEPAPGPGPMHAGVVAERLVPHGVRSGAGCAGGGPGGHGGRDGGGTAGLAGCLGSGTAGGALSTTALVFGREESGLTEVELRQCSHACAVPTGRLQPSMNLSHAVAVVLGELFSRRCGLLQPTPDTNLDPLQGPADQRVPGRSGLEGNSGSRASRTGRSCDAGKEAAEDEGGEGVAAAEGLLLKQQQQASSRQREETEAFGSAGGSGDGALSGGCRIAAEAVAERSAAAVTAGLAAAGAAPVEAGLLPASSHEVDLLVRKVAAIAEAVGMSGEEGHGGGNRGRAAHVHSQLMTTAFLVHRSRKIRIYRQSPVCTRQTAHSPCKDDRA
ncbi:hypothetical protein Agub_g6601, partial [Astrephomene gubernaculifera]